MHVVDLGDLDGPLAVFGGPYSNVQALEALVGEGYAPGSMISTGDLVAYCADANAVVERVRSLGIPVVAGNCEKQLGAGEPDCDCGFEEGTVCATLSTGWYAHALATLDVEQKSWLAKRPDRIVFSHRAKRYAVIHGGASEINRFIWPVASEAELAKEIGILEGQVGPIDAVISGHSGIPFIADVNGKRWLNAGALGLPPNDGDPCVRYLKLDGEPQIERLAYDHEAAAKSMESAGLLQGYQHALRTGWWPSEDILPVAMRAPKGQVA